MNSKSTIHNEPNVARVPRREQREYLLYTFVQDRL